MDGGGSQLVVLTQQFARVTSEYLDRCRTSALTTSGPHGIPGSPRP